LPRRIFSNSAGQPITHRRNGRPRSAGPASESEWTGSIRAFRRDGEEFQRLLRDEKHDLYRPFPWGQGQTLLREALLIIDHNSHHLGQLILVRKALGLWPES
jgi:uncharacterized damage-inducible protein DinB